MMKIIDNHRSICENKKALSHLISPHLELLSSDQIKNKKKIDEIRHVGKFIAFLENDFKISKVIETPDFIISNGSELIGLEHRIIVDEKSKQRKGFFKNIFNLAEIELQKDNTLPNFLANCKVIPYVNFKISKKKELIFEIVHVVKRYVSTGILDENRIIEDIFLMPHSKTNILEDLGWWWQKDLTNELLTQVVHEKEKLILKYRKNSTDKQWLLLVIEDMGGSSYLMDKNLNYNIESEFDKIFVLEDSYNNLYEIK